MNLEETRSALIKNIETGYTIPDFRERENPGRGKTPELLLVVYAGKAYNSGMTVSEFVNSGLNRGSIAYALQSGNPYPGASFVLDYMIDGVEYREINPEILKNMFMPAKEAFFA